MSTNPFESPLADNDDEDSQRTEARRRQVRRLSRGLPFAAAWHLALPLGGALISPLIADKTAKLLADALGLLVSVLLLSYLIWLTTKLWKWPFAVVVSFLGMFPLVGVLAVGLVYHRTRVYLSEGQD